MLEIATPSLQAEEILSSDSEAGKHYLDDAFTKPQSTPREKHNWPI